MESDTGYIYGKRPHRLFPRSHGNLRPLRIEPFFEVPGHCLHFERISRFGLKVFHCDGRLVHIYFIAVLENI